MSIDSGLVEGSLEALRSFQVTAVTSFKLDILKSEILSEFGLNGAL